MKGRVIYFLIIFICLSSSIESKDIRLNFVVFGLGGANYSVEHVWRGGYTLGGWGYNYGIEGNIYGIYEPYKIGFGITYGVISQDVVLKASYYEYDVWSYQGYKKQIFFKVLPYITELFNFWVGLGVDRFKITYAENKWLDKGAWHKIEFNELKDKEEIFQTIGLGAEIKILWNAIFSLKFIIGKNVTSIIAEKGSFDNWQIFLGVGKRFL